MTTQLAIGYLAAGRGKAFGPVAASTGSAAAAHVDAIAVRPAIPRAVIDWPVEVQPDVPLPDVRLPVGAGDPAAEIDGPLSFRVLGARRSLRRHRLSLDASLFSVVAAMLIGLAAAVANVGAEPDATRTARMRTPVVDVRMTRFELIDAPQAASLRGSGPSLAGTGRTPRVN